MDYSPTISGWIISVSLYIICKIKIDIQNVVGRVYYTLKVYWKLKSQLGLS